MNKRNKNFLFGTRILLFAAALVLAPDLRAESLVADNFAFEGRVNGSGAAITVSNGTSINNVKPSEAAESTSVWKVGGNAQAIFSDKQGIYPTYLLSKANNAIITIQHNVEPPFVVAMVWGEGSSIRFGYQVSNPQNPLLVTQSTEKIYCWIDNSGNIQLTIRSTVTNADGTETQKTQTKTANLAVDTTYKEWRAELQVNKRRSTANLRVFNPKTGVSAETGELKWEGTLNKVNTFAINADVNTRVYSCDIASVDFPVKFPINMSFRANSAPSEKNPFDSLENAKNFRIHHLPAKASEIQNQGKSLSEPPIIIKHKPAVAINADLNPGNLLYYVGSAISLSPGESITSGQTIIKVATLKNSDSELLFKYGDAATIYKRSANGKPDWLKSEIVRIIDINDATKELTVARGEKVGPFPPGAISFSADDNPAISPIVSNWTTGEKSVYDNPAQLKSAVGATATEIEIAGYVEPATGEEAGLGDPFQAFEAGKCAMIYGLRGGTEVIAYEFVKISAIDAQNRKLTVTRAQYGTFAMSHAAAKYIAAFDPNLDPETGEPVNGAGIPNPGAINPEWNISPVAPTVSVDGKDYPAAQYQALLQSDAYDGREFDVIESTYMYYNRAVDVDTDLVADYGYRGGVNLWLIGMQDFAEALRAYMGPGKIIQFDSYGPQYGYRGWKYVNGIQMETFMRQNFFPIAFEHLLHWAEAAWAEPRFSYPYAKRQTGKYYSGYGNATSRTVNVGGKDADVYENDDKYFRRVFATGLMAGMPAPYGTGLGSGLLDWPEYHGGTQGDYTWLGEPVGGFVREGVESFGTASAPNLLAGTWLITKKDGWNYETGGSIDSDQGLEIKVTATPDGVRPDHNGVAISYSPMLSLVDTEYTLVFDAKAEDTVSYAGKVYEGIPRAIRIINYGGRDTQSMVLADNKNWRTYYISFVPIKKADGTIKKFACRFGVGETPGTTWIRNVRLYKGSANRLWRRFENGIVFLNESSQDWDLNWNTHFAPYLNQGTPNEKLVRKLDAPDFNDGTNIYDGKRIISGANGEVQVIPPNDARFYRLPNLNN